MGEKNAVYAGFRYIVIGTIGASFYLLGVGYLYITSGSLNMGSWTVTVGSSMFLGPATLNDTLR